MKVVVKVAANMSMTINCDSVVHALCVTAVMVLALVLLAMALSLKAAPVGKIAVSFDVMPASAIALAERALS